ncbi:NADPH:quinone reductase-like Zn-dependent oxidoreductase [Microterricola gilva]|uniref:NADPH:quinone reductase-like Zn-dependent oxidoreductase n=1 Tax=Microterricola gilva TaxID=393267 RepID=A0A4Q8AHJ3_9MICO|nr:NAD(P)-dependent alcohol dehydrogenase [Microterricola gilva]RZU63794.1 NADPH:quinone reductase-like Zn-dependent oxidoreductase [Microterricola gilva]
MRAIIQDEYGDVDALRLADIETPTPGAGEVLIRVKAAGIDAGVWHLMTGLPYLARVMGFGLRRPKTKIKGREFAGVVEAIGAPGKRAHGFTVGDEVYGYCEGSFAEFVCARADRIAPKPASLSFEQAAALPISAGTAVQAVRDSGAVKAGQSVLVIGAAGGVGAFAVQIAKELGASVTGVTSTGKLELVRSLGADHVIDYTRESFTTGIRLFDVIIDTAGHRSVAELRKALTPHGTLVIVGSEVDAPVFGGMGRPIGASLKSPFVGQNLRMLAAGENAGLLHSITELVDAGTLAPVVESRYPLAEAPAAIRHWRDDHPAGKVVVTVA